MLNRRGFLRGAVATTALTALAPVLPKASGYTGSDLAVGTDNAVVVFETKIVRDWSAYIITGMDQFGALVVEKREPAADETIWWAPDSWREVTSISPPTVAGAFA